MKLYSSIAAVGILIAAILVCICFADGRSAATEADRVTANALASGSNLDKDSVLRTGNGATDFRLIWHARVSQDNAAIKGILAGLFLWLLCLTCGHLLGQRKNQDRPALLLCTFLGPLGLIVVFFLADKRELRNKP